MSDAVDVRGSDDRPERPWPGGPPPADESSLVARLKSGDEVAFETLVRTHAGRMLAVAQRLLRNRDDAKDAVQEAFLSAHRHLAEFEGQCRIGTWLHRIVVNAALMRARSQRRRPAESIEDLLPRYHDDGHMIEPAGRWQESGESALDRSARCALVRRSIAALPETYRTVLMLRDIEELEPQEVAGLLGISVNAVNVRLHRARQALRTLLDPHMREDGRR